MAQILIEESAIDTLRDMVQKLQDERDDFAKQLMYISRISNGQVKRVCDYVIAKHTTEQKVMA